MTAVMTNSIDAWLRASRPKTLGAMLCPVLLGNALSIANGHFRPEIMILTIFCSSMLQILSNIINDYGDFKRGSDVKNRLGPPRAMSMGWITLSSMHKGIVVIIFLILLSGLPLVIRGGLPVLLVGIIAIFMSIWYTMGPRPLSYLGFAEVVVFFFFGPIPVFGAFYVQTLTLSPELLVLSLAPGFLSMALIMANNLRDIEEDKKNNKRTIAVRFGQGFSRYTIAFLLLLAILTPIGLVWLYNYSWLLLALSISLMPAWKSIPIFLYEPISVNLNRAFLGVAKSLYAFGVLLSIGLIYGHT